MITNYPVLTKLMVAFIDTLVTILSFILAAYLRNALLGIYEFGGFVDWSNYLVILILIILVWRGLMGYQEAYIGQGFSSLRSELMVVFKTVLAGCLILLTIAFLMKSGVPRTFVIVFLIVNLSLLSLEKVLLYQFIQYIHRRGKNLKRVIVLGTGGAAKVFTDSVKKYSDWGINIVGLVCKNENDVGKELFGYKIIEQEADLRRLLHGNPIDEVIIALPAKRLGEMTDIMNICDEEGVTIRIISPFFKDLISKSRTDMVHGLPIIKFSSVERNDLEAFLKRLIDITGSFILLVLLSPLFLVIAVWIKLDSNGPVFYQWRVLGLNKRPLTSYKFRTMVENADDLKEKLEKNNEMNGVAFKMKKDPRITRVGKRLRKFSLDELPQLWSVLKGDLSLVGPRPPLRTEVEKYEGWHRRKLSVTPGITCLWQVIGRNEINDFDEWMRLDMKYIDEWSLWMDLKIMAKTPWVVLKGTGR